MIDKIKEVQQEDQKIQVVIEEIQDQANAQTYKKLAMVQGVLLAELYKRKIDVHLVYAASWKSSCRIGGRSRSEQKRNAQQYILENYGYKVTQDEADAICIGEHIATKIKNWGRQ
jgi:Holliday junction resolvasome RuvABC endonuclease subunit